jgi:Relaxase/Mobilisation nuclease domain
MARLDTMAIGKITRGDGFNGLMKYLLDEKKNPEIIGGCMVSTTPDGIAREFRQVANLRPTIQKPVRHISISFAPEDGQVDNLVKETVAYRVLDALGYEDCQFMAIGHRRDQEGHDEVHNHDHMHIVTNAVSFSSKHVRDSFDLYKIQEALRDVEREFGLKQIKSSWEVKRDKAVNVERDPGMAMSIAESLTDKPSLNTWLDRLADEQIDVQFNLTDRGAVKGVSFIKDGEVYKSSSLGAKWSRSKNFDEGCLIISEVVEISRQDLPLLKAANQRSQQHPVKLTQVDRAMFDRSTEMAEMAVLNQGHNGKFRNGRVEVALNEGNLKVRRVRPQKLMFEATRVDGEWVPVGFPNIEKMDVQLLERINKVEGMDFKAIVVKRRASFEKRSSPTRGERDVDENPDTFPDDDELEENLIETTPKTRLQEAIEWAAEQADDRVVEFMGYLVQRGVGTSLKVDTNGKLVDISYKIDGMEFQSEELVDASLTQLQAARDLTFDSMRMTTSLSDLNNYSNYLRSKEYAQTLPPEKRGNLGRKANDIIDPLRNDWRNKGRAQTGVNMQSIDPFFQTFETELDLSEKDAAGMEMAREWASKQPKIAKDDDGPDRSRGR